MTDCEKFKKWYVELGLKGVNVETQAAWNARQPEIDALSHRLDAAHRVLAERRVVRSEIDALKAENERLRNALPMTPQRIIGFIGSNFISMEPTDELCNPVGDLERLKYFLSVHDLLSAFDDLAHAMADKGE